MTCVCVCVCVMCVCARRGGAPAVGQKDRRGCKRIRMVVWSWIDGTVLVYSGVPVCLYGHAALAV